MSTSEIHTNQQQAVLIIYLDHSSPSRFSHWQESDIPPDALRVIRYFSYAGFALLGAAIGSLIGYFATPGDEFRKAIAAFIAACVGAVLLFTVAYHRQYNVCLTLHPPSASNRELAL